MLAKFFQFFQGWPEQTDDDICPYWLRKLELSSQNDCVILGGRVVIPPIGRENVLHDLHGGHQVVSRMKSLARSLVWWPNLDKEIEMMVKHCSSCQQSQPSPPLAINSLVMFAY